MGKADLRLAQWRGFVLERVVDLGGVERVGNVLRYDPAIRRAERAQDVLKLTRKKSDSSNCPQ